MIMNGSNNVLFPAFSDAISSKGPVHVRPKI